MRGRPAATRCLLRQLISPTTLTQPALNAPPPTAWALANVAAHSEELAAATVSAGALGPLVACLAGGAPASAATPAPTTAGDTTVLKRFAASALGDIARHSPALAAAVAGAGAVGAVAAQLRAPLANDARLKRQLLCCLMHVCKADAALAEKVVGAGLVPDVGR